MTLAIWGRWGIIQKDSNDDDEDAGDGNINPQFHYTFINAMVYYIEVAELPVPFKTYR